MFNYQPHVLKLFFCLLAVESSRVQSGPVCWLLQCRVVACGIGTVLHCMAWPLCQLGWHSLCIVQPAPVMLLAPELGDTAPLPSLPYLLTTSPSCPPSPLPPKQVLGGFEGPSIEYEVKPVSCPIYTNPDNGRNFVSFADCDPATLTIKVNPCEYRHGSPLVPPASSLPPCPSPLSPPSLRSPSPSRSTHVRTGHEERVPPSPSLPSTPPPSLYQDNWLRFVVCMPGSPITELGAPPPHALIPTSSNIPRCPPP